MSQYETGYRAFGSDRGGSEYDGYVGYASTLRPAASRAASSAASRDASSAASSASRAATAASGYGTSGGTPVVSFENVSKHYGSLRAVDGLSLDLRAGETVALLGPNGAGKSTSLDMLLALRKPTGGRIQMFGSDPYHAVKSGRVGAMLQSGGLMPEVTVRELVTLVTSLHPKPEPINATLKRAGIAEFADQRVDRLSGGQTQRVRFALAICGRSELIVLDEPTAAMDVETRRVFWNSMKEEVAQGRTLLFATHYLEEADQAADRILVINRGRLLADGTPAEIKARAGAKRLSFRLDRLDEPFLLGLPGLVNLEVRHDVVQIQSSDSDATLYAILDAGYRPREIEVTSLGLEQAFLAITAEDDRTNGSNGYAAGETN
jgi:ABC-2 type transport system ATP-binding protein